MAELLREGGVAAQYQVGTITLTATQFTNWTGISTAQAACRFLADDGIPAAINGSSSSTCAYSGNVSSVTLGHVWILANGKLYDPSYKTNVHSTGIDLPAAMGCGTAAAPTCGTAARSAAIPAGATHQGFDSAAQANYVQNVQAGALATTINGFAVNLQHYIETNASPGAQLTDIIGGARIDLSALPAPGPTLPYSANALHSWAGDIPDKYRSRLRVVFDNIDTWLYADEIYGYWIHIGGSYTGGGSVRISALLFEREAGAPIADTPNVYDTYTLQGDDTHVPPFPDQLVQLPTNQIVPLATSTISNVTSIGAPVTLQVDHPYAAEGGLYMDAPFSRTIAFGRADATSQTPPSLPAGVVGIFTPVQIIHGWGRTGQGLAARTAELAQGKTPYAGISGLPTGTGVSLIQDRVRYASGSALPGQVQLFADPMLAHKAATWLAQGGKAVAIVDAISRTRSQEHNTLGVAYESYNSPTQGRIDGRFTAWSAISVTSLTMNAADRQAAIAANVAAYNALEGSAFEQIEDTPNGGNAIRAFALANEPLGAGKTGPAPTRFFEATTANLSSVLAATTNYAADAFNDPQQLITGYLTSPFQTFTMIIPRDGRIGTFQSGSTSLTLPYQGLAAYSSDGTQTAYVLSTGIKGGGAAGDGGGKSTAAPRKIEPEADLARGSWTLALPPELVTGTGEFPHALSYQRFLSPTGETNNWQINGSLGNSGFRALGADTAVEASAAIAALYAIKDLNLAQTFQKRVATIFVSAWLMDQMSANTISIAQPPRTQVFFRLPDGRFDPPAGEKGRVEQTGARVRLVNAGTSPARLGYDYGNIQLTVTGEHGHRLAFSPSSYASDPVQRPRANNFKPDLWTFPEGFRIEFAYTQQGTQSSGTWRMASATNSFGRAIIFTNEDTTVGQDPDGYFESDGTIKDETNRRVHVRHKPSTELAGRAGPRLTRPAVKVILPNGDESRLLFSRASGFRGAPIRVAQILMPADLANPHLAFQYDVEGRLHSIANGNGHIATYFPAAIAGVERRSRGASVDASNNSTTTVFGSRLTPISVTDPLGRTTTYLRDGLGRITNTTNPEGDVVEQTYDARSNVLATTHHAKPGSPLASIVTTTVYGEDEDVIVCIHPASCDRPHFQRDGREFLMRQDWDDNTGLLMRQERGLQGPDVDSLSCALSGGCPVVDLVYSLFGAGNQFRLLTSRTEKISSTDSLTTTHTYNAGNRYVPQSTTVDPGGLNLTTTYAHNSLGDVISTDGPRTDVSDVSNATFDALRRRRLVIEADPDGTGPLPRPATRVGYNPNGWPTIVEIGTTTLADGSNFVAVETSTSSYDAVGNRIRTTSEAGITQTSYDALNRVRCTAMRMNPAVYGSLPADACALSQLGANGPDRITQFNYDAAGQIVLEVRGLGQVAPTFPTTLQQDYARYTYTPNGKRASARDANNNRSVYVYDRFDRLCRLYFPVAAVGQNAANTGSTPEQQLTCGSPSSGADFEAYTYDANNNRTSVRPRSGDSGTISFEYDALNRETRKNLPGTAPDVYSGYDFLGRRVFAHFDSTGGQGVEYEYDRAGRITRETSYGRALRYLYEDKVNRTRVTWPNEADYVQYTYDAMNRMDQVRENGATSGPGLLADYSYDSLGRRATIARGNGTSTALSYDSASRILSLAQDLAGTGQDVTLAFAYSPASQILSRNLSNDAYRYPAPAANRSYTRNGLNQYTAVSGTAFSHDARGNLISDGSRSFTYDLENRLTNVSGGAQLNLAYDPLGRLRETVYPNVHPARQFLYDGDRLVAEYDGASQLKRRFVHGAIQDEPLVWYEYDGATSTRNWLHADHQGSTIGTTTANGAGTIYAYGPYGEPANDNWTGSRFRYTGQIALPEVRLYHYKARVYDPIHGRFLQTDPVGYEDGLNLYAYVDNDPLNRADPTGRVAELYWTANDEVILRVHYTVDRSSGAQPGFSRSGLTERFKKDFSGTVQINGVNVRVIARAIPHSTPVPNMNTVRIVPNTVGVTASGRAETNKVGGDRITMDSGDGAPTGSHEFGHAAGAGDQYANGVSVGGVKLTANVPGPANIMRELGPAGANAQTLGEILRAATNVNTCADGVAAANGKCGTK